jgi:hypothetical protein
MSSGSNDVDTASVLITIYAQGFIGLIEIIIFEIFRHEKDVYEPKRRCRKDRSPKVSLSSFPLSWILPLWSISEKDTLDMIGLDGYMFLRYIRMLTIIFLSIGTYSLAILFPVYYSNSNLSIGINSITMANIKLGDNSLWASFISIWLFTLYFLYLFFKEYENFSKLRQNFMVNGDPDIPKQKLYSIMVENIPKRYQSSKQLKLLFEGLFPGEIETARIALDIKPLVDICDARRKNIIKLETIIASYEASNSVKLPTLSLLNNPALINKMLGHTEVDAIQFYVTEAQFFNQKFAILQKEAEKVDLMSNNIYTDDLFADGITINDWALKFDDKHFTLKSITGSTC